MPVDRLLEDLVNQLLALDPADRPNVKQGINEMYTHTQLNKTTRLYCNCCNFNLNTQSDAFFFLERNSKDFFARPYFRNVLFFYWCIFFCIYVSYTYFDKIMLMYFFIRILDAMSGINTYFFNFILKLAPSLILVVNFNIVHIWDQVLFQEELKRIFI